MGDVTEFLTARDLLLRHREDYESARREFRWPRPERFNWALDYFDSIQPRDARALWVIHQDGMEETRTFAQLTARSNQVANFLRSLGVRRGDRLLLMLCNEAALWELMLAAMKLGVVVIPSSLLLGPDDLTDRL